MLSTTVTIAVPLLTLPLLSVTVKLTVFVPKSAQVKLVLSRLMLAIPHASVLPSSISVVLMLPRPLASRLRLTFWVLTLGLTVSRTVTVAVAEALLLEPSVAVKVTVLGPMFAQVKLLISRLKLDTAQLSLEPLSTIPALMLALPPDPR